jgi:hypothetical protein
MSLLGGVDQEKEEGERTRCDRALLDSKSIDFTQQIVERRNSGLAVTPSARCGAQPFDDLEGFLSFQSLDDAPERAGQPADILVEGEILLSRGHRHSR